MSISLLEAATKIVALVIATLVVFAMANATSSPHLGHLKLFLSDIPVVFSFALLFGVSYARLH